MSHHAIVRTTNSATAAPLYVLSEDYRHIVLRTDVSLRCSEQWRLVEVLCSGNPLILRQCELVQPVELNLF
jgi:hypothetical protein